MKLVHKPLISKNIIFVTDPLLMLRLFVGLPSLERLFQKPHPRKSSLAGSTAQLAITFK